MSRQISLLHEIADKYGHPENLNNLWDVNRLCQSAEINLESREKFILNLPFAPGDATAGTENELQTSVFGERERVDLPISIEQSNYLKNLIRRAERGETSGRLIDRLDDYLDDNNEKVWENSWVRFPRSSLSAYADRIFEKDLLADKQNPSGPKRSDCARFTFIKSGKEFIRIPVSYLLKLSLADFTGVSATSDRMFQKICEKFMDHFLNDNTSPETFSFYPAYLTRENGMGKAVASEMLKRYLLSHLLILYANKKFGILAYGQKAEIYLAPHPPARQNQLNNLVPDSFYRELFMSPCLSGWDRGEEKHSYMHLCHQVLSRSQLNSIAKLKEAGIITGGLVYLPNISNIGLANNGIHLSLGSKKLTSLLKNEKSGYTKLHEKYTGDLVIKIMEHFLPLFTGTYSASPYRVNSWDFHPEKMLGFLSHELDFTHLRMMWRRWKKKARLKAFGRPLIPGGPLWFEKLISRTLRLEGDFLPDYRLIDYFVSVLSTNQSPALNGALGNDKNLKRDLAHMGIFDERMSLYLLYKLREFSVMGFSGFEGRYYSLFDSISNDLTNAANLQTLLTSLAFKYIYSGEIGHHHIPDTPFAESERRQIFFGSAAGIPTFYIKNNTSNLFMKKILEKTLLSRNSARYPGYIRVHNTEYKKALLQIIKQDASDLIEMFGFQETISDLEKMIYCPSEHSSSARLTKGILEKAGVSDPFKLSGREFNLASEKYYREDLRSKHLSEAISILESDSKKIKDSNNNLFRKLIASNTAGLQEYISSVKDDLLNGNLPLQHINKMIQLVILSIDADSKDSAEELKRDNFEVISNAPSVHRKRNVAD